MTLFGRTGKHINVNAVKKNCRIFILLLHVLGYTNLLTAQTVQYSREEAYINNPDHFQMAANIGGTHHLLSFSRNEKPELFIFNAALELSAKKRAPFKFPENATVRVIPLADYYYCLIHSRFSREYLFWKIDADGNCTDMSAAFQKFLRIQTGNIKLGFQLLVNQNQLWMLYHTDLANPDKSTLVMVQADSLLNPVFSHKVVYNFKQDEERLQQEVLVFGRYLLVLKTLQSGSALQLMKVNLATGYTISNTFRSSGYLYTQPGFVFNTADSTITVTALLTEPGATTYRTKHYVFITRLNKILAEQVPFAVLKTQFRKNTNTNFMLVEGTSKWVSFKRGWGRYDSQYDDYVLSANSSQNTGDMNSLLSTMNASANAAAYDDRQGVRFSLLDKKFIIQNDSLVPNTRDSYTIKADQYTRFNINGKDHLLVAQQFYNRKNGLLMVHADDKMQLQYSYVRVHEKYKYILPMMRKISDKSIIVPYLFRREAGLIKITVE